METEIQEQEFEQQETETPTDAGEASEMAENPEDAAASENDEHAGNTEPEAQKRGRAGQRIAQLIAERNDARRRADEAEARMRGRTQDGEPQQYQQTQGWDQPPDSNDFETYDEYNRAMAIYAAQQVRRMEEIERARAGEQQRRQAMAQTIKQKMQAGFEEYGEEFAAVFDQPVPTSEPMVEALYECDYAHKIVWFLAQNPARAAEIAQMSPVAAARQIGLLDARLAAGAGKQPSKAPAPISPLKGKGAQVASVDGMSMDEYAAYRHGQK